MVDRVLALGCLIVVATASPLRPHALSRRTFAANPRPRALTATSSRYSSAPRMSRRLGVACRATVGTKKSTTVREAVAEGLEIYQRGEFRDALAVFNAALELPPQENKNAELQAAYYDIACCHAKLGNNEEGVAALSQAFELGYDEINQIMKDDDLKPLRKMDAFRALVQSMKDSDASTPSLELEAEVRNPFRRFRQFVWGGSLAASGLGSVVSLTQTIGAITGKETIPLSQASQNLAINTGIALGMLFLLNQESKGNEKSKEQILEFREVIGNATERVKTMSSMKVGLRSKDDTLSGGSKGFGLDGDDTGIRYASLKSLQAANGKRAVIVAGNAKFIQETLKNARRADAKGVSPGDSRFDREKVLLVPVVMIDPDAKTLAMPQIGGKNQLPFVAIPQDMNKWRNLLAQEFKYGFDQGNANIFREGIVLAIDEVGRVVQRGVGMPTMDRWEEAFKKWWKQ
mmetsp:Transcript_18270/g.34909  ORF Transcript_18270/g.34909 Transcript_18270/m.34909 type:complete len:460 (-) Transcript_18270:132-1511(-)